MMDDNLLYICPRAGECDDEKCHHRESHALTLFCDDDEWVTEPGDFCPRRCVPASIVVVVEEQPA